MSDLLIPALRGGIVALQLAPRVVAALRGGAAAADAPAAAPAPAPAQPNPGPGGAVQPAPGQGLPGQGLPGQGLPGQGVPGQGVPGQRAPATGLPPRTPAPPPPVLADLPELVLSFVVWLTALMAVLILFLPERTPEQRSRIRFAAIGGAVGSFAIALGALLDQIRQDALGGSSGSYEERHAWLTGLPIRTDYHLAVDGVSLPLLSVTTLVFVVAVAASCRLQARNRLFFSLLLFVATGVSGMLCAADGVLLALFIGLQVVPLGILIALFGGAGAGQAARYLVQSGLAVVLLLVAVVLVSVRSGQGSSDLSALGGVSGGAATAGFWLSLAAFCLLLGVVPFHGWVVDMLERAPAGVAAAVGGAVLTTGAYGLLRITLPLFSGQAWHYSLLIVFLAVLTAVYGTVATLRQRTVRRIAAYSAVSHAGLVLLAIGAQSTIALVGAVVALIANSLVVAMAQLLAAQVEERARTGVLDALGGLGRRAPRLAGLWLFAALSGVGVPLLAGFTGELLVVTGAFPVHRIATAVVVAALLVSTAWVAWTTQRIFSGPAREAFDRVRDAGSYEAWHLVPLVLALIAWGVFPGRVLPMIGNGVVSAIVSHLGGRG